MVFLLVLGCGEVTICTLLKFAVSIPYDSSSRAPEPKVTQFICTCSGSSQFCSCFVYFCVSLMLPYSGVQRIRIEFGRQYYPYNIQNNYLSVKQQQRLCNIQNVGCSMQLLGTLLFQIRLLRSSGHYSSLQHQKSLRKSSQLSFRAQFYIPMFLCFLVLVIIICHCQLIQFVSSSHNIPKFLGTEQLPGRRIAYNVRNIYEKVLVLSFGRRIAWGLASYRALIQLTTSGILMENSYSIFRALSMGDWLFGCCATRLYMGTY